MKPLRSMPIHNAWILVKYSKNGSKCLPLIFVTVATDELLCDKHAVWGMGLNGFIFKKLNKKNKILGAV